MSQFLKITIACPQELQDMLIAELGLINYDSFQEFDNSVEAFIEEQIFNENALLKVLEKYKISPNFNKDYLKNINWNEEWEKNFSPVYVDHKVQIRATFHEKTEDFGYDIIINPKMSFGTGHHETTYLVVSEQLSISHINKRILDVGTGTGILAIMAFKLGATSITATDIDDWCIENCLENFNLNQVKNFDILKGTIDKLTLPGDYDIIYANINKNVLLSELPIYSRLLAKKGILVLSGFYSEDIDDLLKNAVQNKLVYRHSKKKNNWAMIVLNHSNA